MKKIIKYTSLVFLIIILCGCNKTQKSDKLEDIIQKNNYVIVDVRTEEEYKSSHVVGAINIPVDEKEKFLSLDKDKTILVYCKSGNRSHTAYELLNNADYDVIDLGAYESIKLEKE